MAPPEPKPWHQAALGGALMALGSVIFGVRRRGGVEAAPEPTAAAAPPRPEAMPSNVTQAPRAAEPPPRTQYWPPPAPKPIEGTDAGGSAEADDREDHLPVDAESEKLGYEVKDTRAGYLARVMVFSVAIIAGSVSGLFYMVGHYHRADSRTPPLTAQQSAVIVPPGPRLQDHPLHDIATEKKRESELLEYYAWSDPTHRTARIPIARAQALVIGRPLDPVEPAPLPSDPIPPVAPPAAPTSAGAATPAPKP